MLLAAFGCMKREIWTAILVGLVFGMGDSPVRAAEAASPSGAIFAGVDANYSLNMEREGTEWRWNGKPIDLFQGLAQEGARGFRVRLWTGDSGVNGKAYATEIVKRAGAAGLEPYLVIFLSEDWADLMKQPLPAIWKDLDFSQRAAAVRAYSREVVTHFRENGLRSHLYEIGNEIDYGICGVYPGKSTKKNPASLSRECWPQAAELIKASQAGVLDADPAAQFLLHISHWWDAEFCIAFFRFMLDHGVQLDYAGLSYFPSSNIGGSLEMEQFGEVVRELHAAIARPIIVPETAYPSTRDFTGQFSRWKKETPGYPLSPQGQERWLKDFLSFCAHEPAIHSVYYWSPEWYGEGMWKAFALFNPAGESQPAWSAFAASRKELPRLRNPVYAQVNEGALYAVPIVQARKQAVPILQEQLKRNGRVNVDYIRAITETSLLVDNYRVNLRASLSGNLDLLLENPLSPAPDSDQWKTFLNEIDPQRERVVLFAPAGADPFLSAVIAYAKERGLELIVHEKAADQPLKFGLTVAGMNPPSE